MNVFLTGASSGIGEYLAYEYSKQHAHIGITARRIDKLEQIAKKCTTLGGKVSFYQLDVNNQEECKNVINKFVNEVGGIDIVIANAGIGNHDNMKTGDATIINNILHTNIIGLTNTIYPAIPHMINQKSGNIVIISSIASFLNIKFHGGYCASKIAVKTLSNCWRKSLKKHNIKISTIMPGFIKSEMTQDIKFKMPFIMDTQTASTKIVTAIKQNKSYYIFPWQWRIVIPIIRLFS